MTATMEALVVLEPNKLEIQDVPIPTPGPNEVLARVRAVSICGTDAHLVRGDYPGFWPPAFPFIPGHEPSGIVAAVGPGVRALGWAGKHLFGVHRLKEATGWPLTALLPAAAASLRALPGDSAASPSRTAASRPARSP